MRICRTMRQFKGLPSSRPNINLIRMSQTEYARRLNRVIDHIDQHLDQELDLATLADLAHFSRFHFHRIFVAWLGETLGEYLRRRRLEVGALRLAGEPAATVLDIAVSVGFGSAEAFARPFKLQFGQTPSTWRTGTRDRWAKQLAHMRASRDRRDANLAGLLSNPDQDIFRATVHTERSTSDTEYDMDVAIKTFAPLHVAYLRHFGPYGNGVGEFWRGQVHRWLAAHSLLDAPRYGVSYDDPSITSPEKCRYDACVVVPKDFRPTEPAGILTLPGGRYAVAHFHGTSTHITDAWTEMFRSWLPDSGLQVDDRPCLEHYPPDARFDPRTGTFECDICIPICAL